MKPYLLMAKWLKILSMLLKDRIKTLLKMKTLLQSG